MVLPLNEAQIMSWLAAAWLPFARVSGAMLTAPFFSANYIPAQVKVMVTVFFTLVLLPILPTPAPVDILSLDAFLLIINELILGVALGLVLQLIFDAIILAGQLISNGMGLGFAMMVDPQRGVQVPVLSQYLLIICMLLFVAMNGHIEFIALLASTFEIWPVGERAVSTEQFSNIAQWGSVLFSGAIRVAIPAIIALLVVQVAIGVISRAAPTLNLFAVGFPLAMLMGYLIVDQLVPNLLPVLAGLLDQGYERLALLVGG